MKNSSHHHKMRRFSFSVAFGAQEARGFERLKLFTDRGRERRLVSLALPPNRTGGSPASGSPVGSSPPRGLTQRRRGMCKREQPLRGKESIGPTLMITPPTAATSLPTFTQNTAQAHPDPFVQTRKRRVVAMFEITIPAPSNPVDARDDYPQALPIGALGERANLVLELLQALAPRPFIAALEVIPKKVKAATLRGIHNSRLFRVQRQPRSCGPLLHQGQGPLRFRLATTQDDKIVGVPHHLNPLLGQRVVQRIEIDVREQRTDDSSYAKGNFAFERSVRYR
jgi:hypothetical protein